MAILTIKPGVRVFFIENGQTHFKGIVAATAFIEVEDAIADSESNTADAKTTIVDIMMPKASEAKERGDE